MAFEIQQLPKSWLMLFVQSLPAHLKLQLRQCSMDMLQIVDSQPRHRLQYSPIERSVLQQAFQLAGLHMVHLDVSCFPGTTSSSQQQQHLLLSDGRGRPTNTAVNLQLPSLQHLTGRADQHQLLSALSAASSSTITQLSLWCCGSCMAAHRMRGCALHTDGTDVQWPWRASASTAGSCAGLEALAEERHMVAALRDVELLGGCFKLRDSQGHATPIARFLRRLPPHLQSLKILDLADTDKAALEMWLSACLQPLKQLTRLRISCSGNAYLDLSDSAWLELQGLTALQDFVLEPRYEGGLLLGGCHAWLARCAQLTRLHLVCTMEPDRDLLPLVGRLRDLQDLTLFATDFTCDQLRGLTVCSKLTRLSVDSLSVGMAAAVDEEGDESNDPEAGSQLSPAAQDMHRALTAALTLEESAQLASSADHPAARPSAHTAVCLTSIKSLSVGNVGNAEYMLPLATLTPHLTELHDTSWQSAPDLPIETRGADTVDALTGLLQLRVLDVDLYTLDRHAKHLPGLTGLSTLQTLRIQTVGGDLATSNNLRDGLLWMPHLTSLQLYTDEDVNSDEWQQSYNSAEDFLLWQHQSQLQELTIRGSANLGGCLTQADLAAQLPARLPALRCIRLQECPDMQPVQLQGLVRVRAAPLIMVQGCGICVTAQRCAQFSHESRGAVAVEYCS